MNLEHNDKKKLEEDKKKFEKERKEFFEKQKELRKILTSEKLQKLIQKIEKNKNKWEILSSLEELKSIINKNEIKISEKEKLEKIATKLEKEREKEEKQDKESKNDQDIWQNIYISGKIYSDSMLKRWENPDNILDEVIGLIIWITDSLWAIAIFWKDLAIDFVKLPYDIYKSFK